MPFRPLYRPSPLRPALLLGIFVAGLAAAQSTLFAPPSLAQSSRPRANDAYRPPDQGAGLGVLNSDGTAGPAPAYGAPTNPPYAAPAPQYQTQPTAPPSYVGSPPSYSGAPSYGEPAPAYAGTPPAYSAPYDGSRYRAAGSPPPYAQAPRYGEPYTPPPPGGDYQGPAYGGDAPPPYRRREQRADSTYSTDEIKDAGHSLFGSISQGLAKAIEHTFSRQGRPNGYILGEEGGGAFIAGLRYGQGTLFTKDAGAFPVYWQGPSLGFDAGAAGSKTMILVYNLRDTNEIYDRFGGVDGSAYVVGGVGVTLLARDHITMAPIRSGVGLRLGANVGYLKFSHKPTWNPF